MVSLAQRLEKMRSEKGISRVELASKLGFPKMTIEKFETGRLTPTKDQAEKLAAYFGVSVQYLRCESDDPGNMESWLSGNIAEDDAPAVIVKKPVKAKDKAEAAEDGQVFNLLLKSEAFRNAVLDVLATPEGQRMLAQAIRKELRHM